VSGPVAWLDADWLADPATRAVFAALTGAGHTAYAVGGCVRNTLLGRAVSDIDIATDARPAATVAAAEAAGLKAVPTGAAHGTITVVADRRGFEVTTFRHDVDTDGRHAVVRFSDRLEDDAARRDFTMNALYARPDGAVLDPVGGLADLRAGRLRFIGDPDARIAEDYLRILRFFRFHAWYADPAGGVDAAALAACAAGSAGLARVSAERIGHEMLRLLAAPDPAPAVAAMAQAGVLRCVLPGADARALPVLVAHEARHGAGGAPDPIRRLACLGGADAGAALRLSRAEAKRLVTLRDGIAGGAGPAELAFRHGADGARDIVLVRAAVTGEPVPHGLDAALAQGAAAVFPIRAADLMRTHRGPALGAALRRLERLWIESDFALDRAALLEAANSD
jgi:poly(A) polymerase